jgi:1,4-alpha-glucan branching enzyme
MSTTKKYLKSKPVCKVTFKLPKEAAKGAKKVAIVGEFNEWSKKKNQMKALKDGSFTTTLDLEVGNEYQYRFLLDGEVWENDWNAEKYVPTGVSLEENSVVAV